MPELMPAGAAALQASWLTSVGQGARGIGDYKINEGGRKRGVGFSWGREGGSQRRGLTGPLPTASPPLYIHPSRPFWL